MEIGLSAICTGFQKITTHLLCWKTDMERAAKLMSIQSASAPA